MTIRHLLRLGRGLRTIATTERVRFEVGEPACRTPVTAYIHGIHLVIGTRND